MQALCRRARALLRIAMAGALAVWIGVTSAQEGFPLDGTWRAQLDGNRTIVLVMKWDGERINGMINPGPRSIAFAVAELDPSEWRVHIEADSPDGAHIVLTGTLVDIGSYNRRIIGTWTEGNATVDLDLRRE